MDLMTLPAALAVFGVENVRRALPTLDRDPEGHFGTCFVGVGLTGQSSDDVESAHLNNYRRLLAWEREDPEHRDERCIASGRLSTTYEDEKAPHPVLRQAVEAFLAEEEVAA